MLRVRERDGNQNIIYEFRFPKGVRTKTISTSIRGGWTLTGGGAVLDRLPRNQASGLTTFTVEGSLGARVVKAPATTFLDVAAGKARLLDIGTQRIEVDGWSVARTWLDTMAFFLEGRPVKGLIGDSEVDPRDLILTFVDIDGFRSKESGDLVEYVVYPLQGLPTFVQVSTMMVNFSWAIQGVPWKRDVKFDSLWVEYSGGSFWQKAVKFIEDAQAYIKAAIKFVRSAYAFVAGIVEAAVNAVVSAVNFVADTINMLTDLAKAPIDLISGAISSIGGAFDNLGGSIQRMRRELSWQAIKEQVHRSLEDLRSGLDTLQDSFESAKSGAVSAAPGASVTRIQGHLERINGIIEDGNDLYYQALALVPMATRSHVRMENINPDDTIDSLARRCGCDTVALIETNGLRPPFIVSTRRRPVEETGDYSLLYLGDPVKVPGVSEVTSTRAGSADGRIPTAEERLFRSDFQLENQGWKIKSGKPVVLGGVKRVQNRIEQWDFVVHPNTSVSNPGLGRQFEVATWSDEDAREKVFGLGVRQTLEANPYVREVRDLKIVPSNPGVVQMQGSVILIDSQGVQVSAQG